MVFLLSLVSGLVVLAPVLTNGATLENPGYGAKLSGIGLISGWKCEGGSLTVRLNGGSPISLVYGGPRGDTAGVCGDSNNGFAIAFNWALLGDGTHTAVAYDNGVEFARSVFTVTTLGEEFVRGASGECTIQDFPSAGEDATFEWSQSAQNLVLSRSSGGEDNGSGGEDNGNGGEDNGGLHTLTWLITDTCNDGRRVNFLSQPFCTECCYLRNGSTIRLNLGCPR